MYSMASLDTIAQDIAHGVLNRFSALDGVIIDISDIHNIQLKLKTDDKHQTRQWFHFGWHTPIRSSMLATVTSN